MKKMIAMAFAALALAAMTGCSSLDSSNGFNGLQVEGGRRPVAHINARINGVFLFGFIPLFSGSANTAGKTTMFTNTIQMNYALMMASSAARAQGATKLVDIDSRYSSSGMFPWFFLTSKTVEVSVTAVK